MSDFRFRATSPDDAEAVSLFLQRIFGVGPEHPGFEPDQMHWKCWEERTDWPGSRGYVMTSGGEIVAHAAIVPLSSSSGPLQFRMAHVIDWAADPKAMGSGMTLMKRISQSVDGLLAVGGSDRAQVIFPALGFKLLGQADRFARPLRPLRRLAGQKIGLRAGAQFARSLVRTWQARSERVDGWETCRVAPDDLLLAASSIPWPKAERETMLFTRTPDVIGYYLRCPAVPMEFHTVAKDGAIRGYFMLGFAPGQARIVDLWIDSASREDWRTVVQLAVQQAEQNESVAEIVSMASDPTGSQAFLDCGFQPRGSAPVRLLACNKSKVPSVPIAFRMLDSDAAYLCTTRSEFWA